MAEYALSNFASYKNLNNLAHTLDKSGVENKKLDGKEITNFQNKLSSFGIIFDFSKLNDADYMKDIEKQYSKGIDTKQEEALREVRHAKEQEEIDKANEEEHKKTLERFKEMNEKGDYTFKVLDNGMVRVTANIEINLGTMKNKLNIPNGHVRKYNNSERYAGQYYNGVYVDNQSMKGSSVDLPISDFYKNSMEMTWLDVKHWCADKWHELVGE